MSLFDWQLFLQALALLCSCGCVMTDFDILIKSYSTTDFISPSQVSGTQPVQKHLFFAETV